MLDTVNQMHKTPLHLLLPHFLTFPTIFLRYENLGFHLINNQPYVSQISHLLVLLPANTVRCSQCQAALKPSYHHPSNSVFSFILTGHQISLSSTMATISQNHLVRSITAQNCIAEFEVKNPETAYWQPLLPLTGKLQAASFVTMEESSLSRVATPPDRSEHNLYRQF